MSKKITQLTELTSVADDDYLAIVDSSATVTKKIRKDNLFAGFLPPGVVAPYALTTSPTGWLVCDGSAVSRSTYAALYAAIGTTFGSGDGSTTFNLPNLKGKVVVGRDSGDTDFNTIGKTGGEKNHTLTTNEMPVHSHTVSDPGHGHGVNDPSHRHAQLQDDNIGAAGGTANPDANGGNVQHGWTGYSGTGIWLSNSTTGISLANAGGGQGHNNVQPYMALSYIIKT